MKRIQNVPGAPQAVGPYSIYTETDSLIFISGQIGLDPETGKLKDGVKEQTEQLLSNLETILKSRKLTFSNVCKSTIFLTNMDDFALVNQIYGEKFQDAIPARSTIAVSGLPLEAQVEMEFVVAIP